MFYALVSYFDRIHSKFFFLTKEFRRCRKEGGRAFRWKHLPYLNIHFTGFFDWHTIYALKEQETLIKRFSMTNDRTSLLTLAKLFCFKGSKTVNVCFKLSNGDIKFPSSIFGNFQMHQIYYVYRYMSIISWTSYFRISASHLQHSIIITNCILAEMSTLCWCKY